MTLCFFLLYSCKKDEEVKTLRLSHGLDTNHPVHSSMVHLGTVLEQKSKGKLQVKIYPSGQLGAERECLELLQIGSLDITKVSAAVLENFVSEYKILSIPYLFRDKNHSHKVFDSSIGKELLSKGKPYLLKGLCFYDAGSRNFYSKDKPILSPESLNSLKIRVQKSNMAVSMVQLLGGSPTPISWGELYTALQQGVVDGAENNLPSFYTSKHYEVCKYYSFDEHTSVPDILLIGMNTWENLDDQEKIWLEEAAYESALFQRKAWAEAERIALQAIKKAGVDVIYPDKTPFTEKTKKIYDLFNDPETLRIIKEIKSIE